MNGIAARCDEAMLRRGFLPFRGLILLAGVLLFAGCGGSERGPPTEPSLAPLPGVYTGTFPCRDCPGIDTTLWLRPDGRFFIRQLYVQSGDREALDAYGHGRWQPAETDGIVVLEGEGPNRIFRRDGPDALLLRTDSDLEHRLTRHSEATSFTSRIRLTGTVRMEAGGGVFTECLTGYAVPLRESGDFGRFRHQYRSVGARSGTVFVEFEGRFHWTDDGKPASVSIDRFATIRESGSCYGDSARAL